MTEVKILITIIEELENYMFGNTIKPLIFNLY